MGDAGTRQVDVVQSSAETQLRRHRRKFKLNVQTRQGAKQLAVQTAARAWMKAADQTTDKGKKQIKERLQLEGTLRTVVLVKIDGCEQVEAPVKESEKIELDLFHHFYSHFSLSFF